MNAAQIAVQQRINRQQIGAYANFSSKLLSREPVFILALGGSMMAGVNCADRAASVSGRECSYPARFARWLGEAYYGTDSS